MIVWIDGTFGTGKTAVAAELMKRNPGLDVIEFDEFTNSVKPTNPMELFFGKCYPESKRCYVDAFTVEIGEKIEQNDKRVLIIPIALITDYCREHLVENFSNKTETLHVILCSSKEKLLERIKNQEGRSEDIVITYFDEATSYLTENYLDAIRIDTDNMTIEDVASCIEKYIKDRRRDYAGIH